MSRKSRGSALRYAILSQVVSGYDRLEVMVALSRCRPVFLGPQSALIRS